MKFIKTLPFITKMGEDELPVGLWESFENICEYKDKDNQKIVGVCDTSEMFYGTDDVYDPKFCARHFYQCVTTGDGKDNYKLIDNQF